MPGANGRIILQQFYGYSRYKGIRRIDETVVVHIRPHLAQHIAAALVEVQYKRCASRLATVHIFQFGPVNPALIGDQLAVCCTGHRISFKIPLPTDDAGQGGHTQGIGGASGVTTRGQGGHIRSGEDDNLIALCHTAEPVDNFHKILACRFGYQRRSACFAGVPQNLPVGRLRTGV